MHTVAEYVEMTVFDEIGQNRHAAVRIYTTRFSDRNHANHKVILKIISRAQETGHVVPNRRHLGGPLKRCAYSRKLSRYH